jgi:hypothetical protein
LPLPRSSAGGGDGHLSALRVGRGWLPNIAFKGVHSVSGSHIDAADNWKESGKDKALAVPIKCEEEKDGL